MRYEICESFSTDLRTLIKAEFVSFKVGLKRIAALI